MSEEKNSREPPEASDHPPLKKIKIATLNENHSSETPKLHDFKPEKVLCNNTYRKTVSILGRFQDKNEIGLVQFEKIAFQKKDLDSSGYFSEKCKVESFFQNTIYGNCVCYPCPSLNGVKTTIIYPATENHISKYTTQEVHIIYETPELYRNLTLPHITKEQFDLQWMYNVLEGNSEADRVVYDNKCEIEGFVLAPDLKWDGRTKESLYLLAIVRQRHIKSLRDLDGTHLPLLKRVRDESLKVILEKFGVPRSKLRIFFHYQPTYYHLHIHFTKLRIDTFGVPSDNTHLLDTVIDNITMMPQYYKQATLPFTVREMDKLFEVYETNGHVQRIKSGVQELINN